MEFAFYICGLIAILATLRVITHTNPVHALLYLVISLLAISGVFFSLGAYFAGALEIIVYAGAIMVLFVFVVMMLNLGRQRNRTGTPVAKAAGVDWSGDFVGHYAGGHCVRHSGR
nr:NADH dehydrogenase I chain J [Salmonella sp. NCTC 7297]